MLVMLLGFDFPPLKAMIVYVHITQRVLGAVQHQLRHLQLKNMRWQCLLGHAKVQQSLHSLRHHQHSDQHSHHFQYRHVHS